MIFPEALRSREEFVEFARKVEGPLLANMTEFGKTPYLSLSEFSRLGEGYKLVIFPVTDLPGGDESGERTRSRSSQDPGRRRPSWRR